MDIEQIGVAYNVYNQFTGLEVGGGIDWSGKDAEAVLSEQDTYWEGILMYPVHVEQISVEAYNNNMGRKLSDLLELIRVSKEEDWGTLETL